MTDWKNPFSTGHDLEGRSLNNKIVLFLEDNDDWETTARNHYYNPITAIHHRNTAWTVQWLKSHHSQNPLAWMTTPVVLQNPQVRSVVVISPSLNCPYCQCDLIVICGITRQRPVHAFHVYSREDALTLTSHFRPHDTGDGVRSHHHSPSVHLFCSTFSTYSAFGDANSTSSSTSVSHHFPSQWWRSSNSESFTSECIDSTFKLTTSTVSPRLTVLVRRRLTASQVLGGFIIMFLIDTKKFVGTDFVLVSSVVTGFVVLGGCFSPLSRSFRICGVRHEH